jgi:predicted RNA-binding protein with RPS1 domain
MKVFEKLDKNENGLVDVDDISDNYIVDRHPDFIEG